MSPRVLPQVDLSRRLSVQRQHVPLDLLGDSHSKSLRTNRAVQSEARAGFQRVFRGTSWEYLSRRSRSVEIRSSSPSSALAI